MNTIENLSQENLPAGLYLVATPIGNLRDISLRALDTLSSVDLILCEDTRVTKKLLSAYGIHTPVNIYHDHSDDSVRDKMITLMQRGKSIALVSDAGMPLISDPGYKFVRECRKENILITSIPGANAFLMGLQLSALPCEKFTFLGFLPPKAGPRKTMLKEWASHPVTFGFYEAKQRILKTLKDCQDVLGEREISISRELTKKFEEVLTGSIDDIISQLESRSELKGEFVVFISPGTKEQASHDDIKSDILHLLGQGERAKDISIMLAEKYNQPRSQIYDLILELKQS